MKVFIILIFFSVVIAGCSKNGDVTPKNNNSESLPDGGAQTPGDTTPKLTHDDSIHMAAFKVKPQLVKTSVSGNTLTLVFDENIDLLFTAQGYQKISSVHLLEDFKNTLLSGFDYTTVAEGGNTTLNWVDNNLNNVVLKTVTDTVINKIEMVKVNVHRPFTFSKIYASNQAALAEQTVFVAKTNDLVNFTSYCYYNQKNYRPVSVSAGLVYSK